MWPIETTPLLKKIYPKITEFLKFRWFFVSILLGFITSWFIKDSITPLLFWGKSFDGRSLLYQVVILIIYVFFTSAIFFCALIIVSLLFPRQLNRELQKLHVVFMNKLLGMQLFHKMMAGLKYVYKEIGYTLQVFTIKKEDVHSYLSSPYRIILIILFTILFFPHVFVVVKDINFVTAYEVDPGSIIASIMSLYQHYYNMNAGYHSAYYGWTYFSINYFLLMPVYLAKALKIVTDDFFLFVGIRFIFFMIGLSSTLAFFEVAKRTLKQNLLSFIAAMLYVASPVVFKFFYFLHPETTGLLFLFLSILCLIRYHDGQAEDHRWYIVGLLSLVLSALSKQVFFFTAPPVIFLYIYFYCHHHKKPILLFLISKQFIKILFASLTFSLVIFFAVNPFAFFQPNIFIDNQILLFTNHTHGSATYIETIGIWLQFIKATPIIFTSILLFPFTLLGAVVFGREQKIGRMLYVVNILGAMFFVTIISITSRSYITYGYFLPAYPFFVLNFLSIPLYIVRKWNVALVKILTILPLTYLLLFVILSDFSVSLPEGYARFMYQNSITYKMYNYIEKNIPGGSKIAYDLFVAIPSDKGIIACHFWQGCGTDYIEEFQPDYVIFDMNWTFQGVHPPTARLTKYVNDHKFILIDTIDTVSVWKKPDN